MRHQDFVRNSRIKADGHNLGGAEAAREANWATARKQFAKAVALSPDEAKYHHNLGVASQELGLHKQAVSEFKVACSLEPRSSTRRTNLAKALEQAGALDEAVSHYRRAFRSNIGELLSALRRIASTLVSSGDFTKGIEILNEVLSHDPRSSEDWMHLGICLCNIGRVDDAVLALEKALRGNRSNFAVAGYLLLIRHYLPSISARRHFRQHIRIARAIELQRTRTYTYTPKDRQGARRLKIGYISADFREHSVSYLVEPILQFRNKHRFEVVCFSDVLKADATTRRIKSLVDRWYDISGMTDGDCAEIVHQANLDILVDLGGYTGRCRLPVFTCRPAPIQITAFGYPDTTGLNGINFKLTDSVMDPEGETECFYTEALMRINPCFLCYAPPRNAPAVRRRPASKPLVFCCFNARPKITGEVLTIWSRILKRVPESTLAIKSFEMADPNVAHELRSKLQHLDIDQSRVTVFPAVQNRRDHLEMYGLADIALDPFPYNGAITTCEALWMGLPVVALRGKTHVARTSSSILQSAGLQSWVANDTREYIEIAVAAANQRDRLAKLRATLRSQMRNSPLLNAPEYVAKLEACYERAFEQWISNI